MSSLPVTVVLHHVRSLYNVGSFFRTADGAGVREVVLSGITATPPRKEIAKTALGAEESVRWVAVSELALEVADLGPELVDLGGQGEDERPHGGRHLGGEFGRDAAGGGSRHVASVAKTNRPDQINCARCEPLRSGGRSG